MVATECIEQGDGYILHFYRGKYKWVPEDWRFPRCGVFDLWQQWWIGDQIRQIPPLKYITIEDVNHLKEVPLAEEEMHGRTGGTRECRREPSKLLSDMRFLMKWITDKVAASPGGIKREITISAVDCMFQVVTDEFSEGERNGQKKWLTVVRSLRKRLRTVQQ